ncbi:hypothetical protein FRB99_005954 [Tulasnella sp. 403]|nr:hypothetical protein FRB99_005954 [Tulasnella sp. 403]
MQDVTMVALDDERSAPAAELCSDATEVWDPMPVERPELRVHSGSSSAPDLNLLAVSVAPPCPSISYVSDVGNGPDSSGILHPSEVGLDGFSSPAPVFPFLGGIYGPSPIAGQQLSSGTTHTQSSIPSQPYGKSPYPDVETPPTPPSPDQQSAPQIPTTTGPDTTGYDLLPRINGLYKLLELYSENATGGLVDKIIIAQESLKSFLDFICPGAYKSVTKIDFLTLDLISIKMIGIYGSKIEIVRFLREAGALDAEVEQLLLVPDDFTSHVQPRLPSGIYALIPPNSRHDGLSNDQPAIYIVYWPEETTWDDDAIGTVRKNRVTFMRYLTRLTDQVRALMSSKCSAALDWRQLDNDIDSDESGESSSEFDDDFDDRFFKFEVAKTNEQEEAVATREGFKISHRVISNGPVPLSLFGEASPQHNLNSSFVCGETLQALVDGQHVPATTYEQRLDDHCTTYRLRSILQKHGTIRLANSVDEKGLDILLNEGSLKDRVPDLYRQYRDDIRKAESSQKSKEADESQRALKELAANHDKLLIDARRYVTKLADQLFPMLDLGEDTPGLAGDPPAGEVDLQYFFHIQALYPSVKETMDKFLDDQKKSLTKIKDLKYGAMKKRFLVLQSVEKAQGPLSGTKREEVIATLLSGSETATSLPRGASWGTARSYLGTLKSMLGFSTTQDGSGSDHVAAQQDDPGFISHLAHLTFNEPAYHKFAEEVFSLARASLAKHIASVAESLVKKMETVQEQALKDQSRHFTSARASQEMGDLKAKYRGLFETALNSNSVQPPLTLTSVVKSGSYSYYVHVKGYYRQQTTAECRHQIWALDTPEDDKLKLRESRQHVPKPRVSSTPIATCSLPLDWSIRHLQVLINGPRKHVLLVVDRTDSVGIYLFPFFDRFASEKAIRQIPNMKNRRYQVACDEQRRLLAIVISDPDKCVLQLFAIDESFANIQSRGSPFDLRGWYQDCSPDIVAVSFFAGPGTIQLNPGFCHVQTSPDGTALVAIEQDQHAKKLRVFHQASFGHNQAGITADLPNELNTATSFTLTSIGERRNVYLMGLSLPTQSLNSVAVDISRKETEYQFRAKADKAQSLVSTPTVHNSLIDCFSEVWSRYPVIAAIERETFAGSTRLPLSVTFVSEEPDRPFEAYFKRMIRNFEQICKKPTDKRLDKVVVEAARFEDLEWEAPSSSVYKAGEWLAELLCLIPIHIALARENRFVPLKDGILDPALERQLLGAEVATIIDAITVGWYESIFSSYMATKPVKVVSSMGEQSVGKSYSLNHLVDSSFAGSAVRTTEVRAVSELAPVIFNTKLARKGCLAVRVHSIERTAQEDMLLVLFNTALSNLVLFRNNFALSRDVANMFTSFQASTHLFDPASNPKLFKGLLAIVIKDVVDGDKKEIVKEFSSKFSQIVSTEQADNFITVLHDSQLTVIPWNVIQSREFYTLFSKLSKHLFRQKMTHATAGEFLITLKTLMAKLKAQDWGSIDHTVIKHRVAALTTILPNAFSTGRAEVHPAVEDLKNLDNQEPVIATDSEAEFYIGKSQQDIETALSAHLREWRHDAARHSIEELQAYLKDKASLRLAHVQTWLDVNTSRFPTDNADIRGLRRLFEDGSTALLGNIQLCLAECVECHLRCMLPKSHDSTARHDCKTNHDCETPCDYASEHSDLKYCGLPTERETGPDIRVVIYVKGLLTCVVNLVRSTPKRDVNAYARNPLNTQAMNTFAQLGRTNVDSRAIYKVPPLPTARFITVLICAPCPTTLLMTNTAAKIGCPAPSNASYAPATAPLVIISMVLLRVRYIFAGKHEHDCSHECELPGICQVNTTPQSVKELFTGRHDSFHYTKENVAMLDAMSTVPSQIPITTANRGMYIRLLVPLDEGIAYLMLELPGHPQAEHDTAHGSMEYTAWAVEGAADVTIEVQGRKFGAQDNGAPQLCSSVCRNLGRHAHIDYCRNSKGPCQEPESEHINERMLPNADRPKDWVSHKVFWARTGFKDSYSNVEQREFSLCDVQCAGTEHQATTSAPARPSYCTLPIFHPPQPTNWQVAGNTSYVSADGHSFGCPNPNNLRQAYHVIFVLDNSGSMTHRDRRPLPNQPVTQIITANHNDRFGAVLSALYGFWITRESGATGGRRDGYSVITFDGHSQIRFENDFNSPSDDLLRQLARIGSGGGTNFDAALRTTQTVMERNWSTNRSPVVIFLSDGECGVRDDVIYDLCNRAVALGKPLSFHSVAFGTTASSLRRMVTLAEQVAQAAPRDPLSPLVPCGYTDAMDTIRLAETFLQIADSLKKPRASLIRV